MSEERVTAFLRQHGVTPAIRQFEDTHSAELAAEAIGVHVSQISKTLVIMAGGAAYLVMVSGDRKADFGKLKALLGARPKMANPDEVQMYTGYEVGAVSPFALPEPLPIYLDRELARFDPIWMSGGTSNSLLALPWNDLVRLTAGTIVDVTAQRTPA